jgi:hypothetical protein
MGVCFRPSSLPPSTQQGDSMMTWLTAGAIIALFGMKARVFVLILVNALTQRREK